jgi:hypothetical protein
MDFLELGEIPPSQLDKFFKRQRGLLWHPAKATTTNQLPIATELVVQGSKDL